jgi:hypothetical protein
MPRGTSLEKANSICPSSRSCRLTRPSRRSRLKRLHHLLRVSCSPTISPPSQKAVQKQNIKEGEEANYQGH